MAEGQEKIVDLNQLFGSRIVFVSATDPAYLITVDERRFRVGSVLDDETTLIDIKADKIVLGQADDNLDVRLPTPGTSVQ